MEFVATILVGLGVGMLTVFGTPWLHHNFWKEQQRDELRLRTTEEFNIVLSQIVADYDDKKALPSHERSVEIYRVTGQIAAQFSEKVEERISRFMDSFKEEKYLELLSHRNEILPLLYQEVLGAASQSKWKRILGLHYLGAPADSKNPSTG